MKVTKLFFSMCHEVERYYVDLERSPQIRVEKWVEKLTLTGLNSVWKKHRNAYMRLMLTMILKKEFTEPFNHLPPDGPLPSFPVHLQPYSYITHGKSFWRDVYQRIHNGPISLDLEVKRKEKDEESPVSTTEINMSTRDLRDSNDQLLEIRRLDMVTREQERKLDWMEQKLEEERLKREAVLLEEKRSYVGRTAQKRRGSSGRSGTPSSRKRR